MNPVSLRFRGELAHLSADERLSLFNRSSVIDDVTRRITSAIIARVRNDGDDALRALARELDSVELESLEVPRELLQRALESLDATTRTAMERAAANIERVHRAWLPQESQIEVEPGVIVGRRPDPLGRVGVYAPGGRAAYPSSVLMGAVPARVAGVSEVILCSPPGQSGIPSDSVLAAAAIAGVDRVFSVGGAGAIAAMAFGTESIPRVDKIVGPGNAFVAEAKAQLASIVAFDSPAGPSELLVIADESADPATIAREMLAQAEHDPRAVVVTIAIGRGVAENTECALRDATASTSRAEIVAESLGARGGIVWVSDVSEAVAAANAFAPEHLLIATGSSTDIANQVRNAGTVFVGESSSVAFGDYLTGANHVLPTGGLARSYSGLSTLDFFRWTTWQSVSADAAARLAEDTAAFAAAEGLDNHATAARAWSNSG
jgi:histidinol dehydrogenase